MKSIQKYIACRAATGLLALGLASGCDSFVEVDLPASQLTSAAVFNEPATAQAALMDIYAKLRDNGLLAGYGSGMHCALGAYADELDYYGPAVGGMPYYYQNTLLANNGENALWWSSSYNQIYAANALCEGVAASANLSQEVKGQLIGEALFIRALVHFHLVNLYGAVPYIATTDHEQNKRVSRMGVEAVYQKIIEDLEAAQELLPGAYVGDGRIRANRFVVAALLSRVYLYHGDYAAAANAASAVLNETELYNLNGALDAAFLKDSPGTIWQLMPQSDGRNTEEGATYIFTSGPPPFVALGGGLMAAFEAGDLRKEKWTKTVTDGANSWHHANKYKQQALTASTVEYAIVFRISELYLIRAEARARQGELSTSREDLDAIRNLAGLAGSTAVTQQELLGAILRERRVELFTEGGHRFFDLKRYQLLDASLSGVKPGWNSADAMLPIPEPELSLNPGLLPQNPGY